MAWRQARLLDNAVAVSAQVEKTDLGETTDSEGEPTFSPKVTFHYKVAGREFTSNHVYAIDVGQSSHSWARGVIARFHAGDKVTAFCDPARPGEVFLLRQADFFPYMFLLVGMIFALAISAAIGDQTGSAAWHTRW